MNKHQTLSYLTGVKRFFLIGQSICSRLTPANQHSDLLLRRNDVIDVSAALQPLLHGNEQFDPVHHQLGQHHLAQAEGRRVAHAIQRRGFWEMKRQVEMLSLSGRTSWINSKPLINRTESLFEA